MGSIKKQNQLFKKPGICCFFEEGGLSMTSAWIILIGGFTDMHRHEESFSYWNSLLFLKSSDFKDLAGKKIWNWYLPGTTIHYHCICMNEWQKKFYKGKWKAGESFPMSYRHLHIHLVGLSRGGTGLGNLRVDSSALRRKLKWAPHSRCSIPFLSPFKAIIWAGFGTV